MIDGVFFLLQRRLRQAVASLGGLEIGGEVPVEIGGPLGEEELEADLHGDAHGGGGVKLCGLRVLAAPALLRVEQLQAAALATQGPGLLEEVSAVVEPGRALAIAGGEVHLLEEQPPAGGPREAYLVVQGSWVVRCRR